MVPKDDRWLNQTGLNLIRIVIGSYFAAVSLDLVVGVDQKALFLPVAPGIMADVIGSTLLLLTSVAFMSGFQLRITALVLALFVFCSSLVQNFLLAPIEDVSAFWRDVTLVCAIILNYSNMNRREMRRADLMRRRNLARARKIRVIGPDVTPRRVQPQPPERPQSEKHARPALQLPSFMKHPQERQRDRDLVDINLFANI
ncbi:MULTISPECIES: hypothetical protein [unclassified Roseovarius]|uniref:hypothetical protein n=1 Tax=unclassified Roseovarius TaxID=2614913 RepID=UPI00273EA7D9|nr:MULTISPECIES: hypothetical protein [unclassified Roseovarius]